MLRAVLDANVYVSAAIRPEGPPGRIIERFLREATFQIVISLAIADEVLRALTYPKVRQAIRGHIGPELWFEDLVLLADLVSDTRRALASAPIRTMTSTSAQRWRAARPSWSPEIVNCLP